ncbi:cytochrome c/c1 heme-lyase [Suillus occidentalis]|nr:cytochrome c/c1 heme-lyase [Suillus occidentalis]
MGQSNSSPHPVAVMRTSPLSSCPMHDALAVQSSTTTHLLQNRVDVISTILHLISVPLPTERTMSSIPRVVDSETRTDMRQTWEYPQQFYNALLRKSLDTPAEHVETVRAWGKVLKWERRVAQEGDEKPHLARFKGRPGDVAKGKPPFDRHNWIVRRPRDGTEVRYDIDCYSAPSTPDGDPGFALDVWPALDSFESIQQRMAVGMDDAWEELREKGWGKSERRRTRQAGS